MSLTLASLWEPRLGTDVLGEVTDRAGCILPLRQLCFLAGAAGAGSSVIRREYMTCSLRGKPMAVAQQPAWLLVAGFHPPDVLVPKE